MSNLLRFGVILLLAGILIPETAGAQNIEISPFGGYFFAGKLVLREGDLNVKNAANYGVTIDYEVRRDIQIELMFNRTDTRLVLKQYPSGVNKDLFDISENYFHIGGIYRVREMEKGYLFTSLSLGAVLFSPDIDSYVLDDGERVAVSDEWRFSFALGAGIKHFFSDKVGIRTQIRLLMPVYFAGGGLYFGTGGSGLSLGAGTVLPQADATIGLIFVL
jgi:hypothetical protein